MNYIDFHCDTLCSAFFQKKNDLTKLDNTMVNLGKLKNANCTAQFFAIYMLPEEERDAVNSGIPDDDTYISSLKSILDDTEKINPGAIAITGSFAEFEQNRKNGKISAFLTLEDGRAVQGSIERLEKFHSMGVRLITLTWNFANCFAFPNSKDPVEMSRGLTAFGKDAVCRMNELGMFVDVSHLSDGGFWDVVNVCKKPFIASHSNCRSLSPHQRNMTDDMIKALADAGGVAGLNFCPAFLNADITDEHSTAKLIAKHAKYMANCGGLGVVAIGSDFDGIRGIIETDGPDKMDLVWDELKKQGFSYDEIDYIAYKNGERVLKEVLK